MAYHFCVVVHCYWHIRTVPGLYQFYDPEYGPFRKVLQGGRYSKNDRFPKETNGLSIFKRINTGFGLCRNPHCLLFYVQMVAELRIPNANFVVDSRYGHNWGIIDCPNNGKLSVDKSGHGQPRKKFEDGIMCQIKNEKNV